MAQREYAETNKQQVMSDAGMVAVATTCDAEHLRAIHKRLFANVYEWAADCGDPDGLQQVRLARGHSAASAGGKPARAGG